MYRNQRYKKTYKQMPISFKEFISTENYIDEDTKELFVALSESHPLLRNHSVIQRIVNDKTSSISLRDVSRVNRDVLARTVHLAKTAQSANLPEQMLILSEQSLLSVIASTLSSTMSAKSQNTINNLSKITAALK